ncbi:hypothetical protein HYDPIDRAFT_104380 [Hydnomerulius pinastri MD-312]|nr:hypothetical protein HYDPIDRAFT_104380 [Hydnomerulius pinastri MD-312]
MHNTTITDLPHELLDDILQRISRETCFCRVSKGLSSPATRWLYRDLRLESAKQSVQVCRAIISNPIAAQSVRTLVLADALELDPVVFYLKR